MIATTLLRWICDPAKLEAIEGDLAELYQGRESWRYVREVAGICLRQPRTALRSLAAAVIVFLVVGPVGPPIHYTVHASDPAGTFALEIQEGRVIAAMFDGTMWPSRDVVQMGDTLVIRGANHGADFLIAMKPGGITWYPRSSSSR
jgi:hypothetical protein